MSIPHGMQLPTHHRLHIRDAQDAHVVLEAVRRGLLQPITRRLNDLERSVNIRSGTVFVWEESDRESGIKRWTDGRLWSQSRMREPFLFYDERLPEELYALNESSPSYRFVDGTCRGVPTPAVAHYDRSNHHPKGLVKQAYSAKATLTPGGKPRKWHLTAYFSYEDLEELPTVENDITLRRISPPPGVFRNGKARSRDNGGMYFPQRRSSSDTSSSSSSSPPPSPPRRERSLPPYHHQSRRLPPPVSRPTYGLTLPPLHAAIQTHPKDSLFFGSGSGSGGPPQTTRAAEDQRVIHILNAKHLG